MKNKSTLLNFTFLNIFLLFVLSIISIIFSYTLPQIISIDIFLVIQQITFIINLLLSLTLIILSIAIMKNIYSSDKNKKNKVLSTINFLFIIFIQIMKYTSRIYINNLVYRNISVPSFINLTPGEFLTIFTYILTGIKTVLYITVIIIYIMIYFSKPNK